MHALQRSSTLWTVLLLALMFGLRCVLSLTADGFLGVDGGAYLLSRNSVLGNEPTGTDFTRPPLAPGWLLVPFTSLFGDVTGYNLFSAFFSMTLPVAVAIVARSWLRPLPAFIVVVLVGFDWLLTTMIVTGVLPLIGFSLILLAIWGLHGIASDGLKWRHWLTTITAIALIPFVNQTSAGLAALVLPLAWLVLPRKTDTVWAIGIGAFFACMALPWYLDASPTSAKLVYPGPLILPHNVWEHQLWIGMGALFLAWKTARRRAPLGLHLAMYLVAFLAVLQMFQSYNEVVMNLMFRATFLMMPFVWLIVGWLLQESHAVVRPKLAAAALALLVVVGVQQFNEQERLSAVAPSGVVAAMDLVPETAGAIVTNSYSMALYVAAETQKPVRWTNYLEPPPYYTQADRDARCTLGWVQGCGPADDVTHVLVDEKWPLDAVGLAPADLLHPYGAPERKPWYRLATVPWLRLVYENGTVKLYEVVG